MEPKQRPSRGGDLCERPHSANPQCNTRSTSAPAVTSCQSGSRCHSDTKYSSKLSSQNWNMMQQRHLSQNSWQHNGSASICMVTPVRCDIMSCFLNYNKRFFLFRKSKLCIIKLIVSDQHRSFILTPFTDRTLLFNMSQSAQSRKRRMDNLFNILTKNNHFSLYNETSEDVQTFYQHFCVSQQNNLLCI